jgi:hypothetical protein
LSVNERSAQDLMAGERDLENRLDHALLHWRDKNCDLASREEIVRPLPVTLIRACLRVTAARHIEFTRIDPRVFDQRYSLGGEDSFYYVGRKWKVQLRAVTNVRKHEDICIPVNFKAAIRSATPQNALCAATKKWRLRDRMTTLSTDANQVSLRYFSAPREGVDIEETEPRNAHATPLETPKRC